jgi:cytochrome b pre-mRNA-processing protein 3
MAAGIARVYGGDEAKGRKMLFSRARRREREEAERVYYAALAAARRPYFYLRCGIPDTLQGRFEMVSLHLFPVLHRLMHEPGDDPELAQRVAESLVDDMDGALREVGVSDTRVPKRMKTLYGSFAGRMAAYRQAFGEGEEAVGAAIARNVFPEGGEEHHVLALARYLRDAVAAIEVVELDLLRRGELPFPAVELEERET